MRNPPWFAFVAVLVLATPIALLTPPLKGSDERDHFTRAYLVSSGHLFPSSRGDEVGGELPGGFDDELDTMTGEVFFNDDETAFLDAFDRPAPDGEAEFASGGLTASYAPGPYLQYIAAVSIGRVFEAPLVILLYAARLAGVLAYAGVFAWAVARLPTHRWILVVGGLLPVAVNQAATVSADGMATASTFLAVALALRLSVDDEAQTRRLLIESAIAATLLALGKPPYFLFVLLFVVPAWKHRHRLAPALTATLVGTFAIAALWLRYQSNNSVPLDTPGLTPLSSLSGNYAYRGINSADQTQDVLTRPWDFASVLWETLVHEGIALPRDMIGLLGLHYVAPLLLIGFVVVFALSCAIPDTPPRWRLTWAERGPLLALTAVVALAICVIIYTRVNQYGAPRIDQLSPRYFLPLVPLAFIAAVPQPRVGCRSTIALGSAVSGGLLVLGAATVIGLVSFHY